RVVLYRSAQAVYRNEGHGHRVSVNGVILQLDAPIYHDDRKPLSQWFVSQQRYARQEAEYLLNSDGGTLSRIDRVRLAAWPAPAAAGHEGIIFDSLLFGHREFVRWGKLIQGDIRDAAALDAVFAAYRIDAVMHFAALAYVGESVTPPGRYYDVNLHGTRTLLDA